jgi:hypothetical protein
VNRASYRQGHHGCDFHGGWHQDQQRLAGDGYLFFRGLLPADQVLAAGTVVRDRLREGGWTDPDDMPSGQQRAVNPSDALSDPAFRAAVMSAEFNRIPYLPPLRRMVREVLGRTAFSFPVKVLRAVYPERPETRPLTAAEPGWASTDYRPGDVIVFHCLTPHAALPNTTMASTALPGTTTAAGRARLRLSGDFRWQLPDKPVPTEEDRLWRRDHTVTISLPW